MALKILKISNTQCSCAHFRVVSVTNLDFSQNAYNFGPIYNSKARIK